MAISLFVWLFTGLFLLYRSYRRFRRAQSYRSVLRGTGKNGILIIAANGNVRRALYGIAIALVTIGLSVFNTFNEPGEFRDTILAVGATIILALFTISGIADDRDTNRLIRYGIDDSGRELARQDTLIEVQADVASVHERVARAVDAANDAYEVANNVNTKIAGLAKRATDSEKRADAAEIRADVSEHRADASADQAVVSEKRADDAETRADASEHRADDAEAREKKH